MRRTTVLSVLVLTLALLLPTAGQAQAFLFLGGGATLPTGDFGKYAGTGWMLGGGVGFPVGDKGLMVGAEGFYGANSHDDYTPGEFLDGQGGSSDRTDLYGAAGVVAYRFGDMAKPGLYVLGLAGLMVHKYVPATGSGDSSTGFLYGAGAGVEIPLSKVNLWFEGRWQAAGYSEGNDSETTSLFGLFAGISIPLRGGS